MNVRTKKIIFTTIVVLILTIMFVFASQAAKRNVETFNENRVNQNSVVEGAETAPTPAVSPADDGGRSDGLAVPF